MIRSGVSLGARQVAEAAQSKLGTSQIDGTQNSSRPVATVGRRRGQDAERRFRDVRHRIPPGRDDRRGLDPADSPMFTHEEIAAIDHRQIDRTGVWTSESPRCRRFPRGAEPWHEETAIRHEDRIGHATLQKPGGPDARLGFRDLRDGRPLFRRIWRILPRRRQKVAIPSGKPRKAARCAGFDVPTMTCRT